MLKCLVLLPGLVAAQGGDDSLEFLEEEASVVVTGSLRPEPARRAPSTVHVISGDDMRRSGAQTLWDGLRLAPGVDVFTLRALHGEVSLRGMNKVTNNRVLVLVDGRVSQNGFFDYVEWETIPIALEDVERVEIVAGPASSVYGANALLGVINIITKRPGQLEGVRLNAWWGERETLFLNQQVGGRRDDLAYKFTASHRSGRGFDSAATRAGETASFNSAVVKTLRGGGELSLSGGLAVHDVEVRGPPNALRNDGVTGFARGDFRHGRFASRLYWNAARARLTRFGAFGDINANYDTVDGLVSYGRPLGERHDLVAGGNWRFNRAESGVFEQGPVEHHLFGFFLEDQWAPREDVRLVIGSRLDRHPRAELVVSPRGSALWEPAQGHVLRLTAGESFRNPTLLENDILVTLRSATQETRVIGNHDLDPERLQSVELGYVAELDRLRLTVALYRYKLRDQIVGRTTAISAGPPQLNETRAVNGGATRAVGVETGVDYELHPAASVFGTYTGQSLRDTDASMTSADASPKHKANAGLRVRRGRLSSTAWAHWQSRTVWSNAVDVADYGIVNVWLGWAFEAVEVGLSAFNVLNTYHYEAAPPAGMRVGRRLMGMVSYTF